MLNDEKLTQTAAVIMSAIRQIADVWEAEHAAEPIEKDAEYRVAPIRSDCERTILCYLAGCNGLSASAQQYGQSRYKVGTTTYPNVNDRLIELGREKYGAAVRTGNDFRLEDGYAAWVALMIRTTRAPNDPRIVLLPRAIQVSLPPTQSRRQFDEALHQKLASRSANVIRTEPERFTIAYEGATPVVRRAREIYHFKPLEDGDRLLEAIEEIIGNKPRKRVGKSQRK